MEKKLSFEALTMLMAMASGEEVRVESAINADNATEKKHSQELIDAGLMIFKGIEKGGLLNPYELTAEGLDLSSGIHQEQQKGIATLQPGVHWTPKHKVYAFSPPQMKGDSCVIMDDDRKICMICYFSEVSAMNICAVLNNSEHVVPKKTYVQMYNIAIQKDRQITQLMNHIIETNKSLPKNHPLTWASVKLMESIKNQMSADNSMSPTKPKTNDENSKISVVHRNVPTKGNN